MNSTEELTRQRDVEVCLGLNDLIYRPIVISNQTITMFETFVAMRII